MPGLPDRSRKGGIPPGTSVMLPTVRRNPHRLKRLGAFTLIAYAMHGHEWSPIIATYPNSYRVISMKRHWIILWKTDIYRLTA